MLEYCTNPDSIVHPCLSVLGYLPRDRFEYAGVVLGGYDGGDVMFE